MTFGTITRIGADIYLIVACVIFFLLMFIATDGSAVIVFLFFISVGLGSFGVIIVLESPPSPCPMCQSIDAYVRTGNKRPGSDFYEEFQCKHCGKKVWKEFHEY